MGAGTELGRVRGKGSAKHGGEHWINQRVSAAGNILLTFWLAVSFWRLPNFSHQTLAAWIAQPVVAVPLILMMVSIFWHIRLGFQVLIEDYIHDEGLKFAGLLLMKFYVVLCLASGIFSVVKIALGGVSH